MNIFKFINKKIIFIYPLYNRNLNNNNFTINTITFAINLLNLLRFDLKFNLIILTIKIKNKIFQQNQNLINKKLLLLLPLIKTPNFIKSRFFNNKSINHFNFFIFIK
jgi:hypothetical protein